MRVVSFSLVAVAMCVWPAHGQEYSGRVQGLVTDLNGAPIANAKITLRNSQTGAAAEKQTEENGSYRFDFVLPREPGAWTARFHF